MKKCNFLARYEGTLYFQFIHSFNQPLDFWKMSQMTVCYRMQCSECITLKPEVLHSMFQSVADLLFESVLVFVTLNLLRNLQLQCLFFYQA